ncbi:hypothetical protein E2562_033152 [Oryza meyeriana var. granulata]|uniref:Uncharacterized protein n=1 Tax=Oryza meyeriana var. granulata TaxID=110450 RepID=A0A6G1DSE3_9ORYZ|nr:hypothetical protein E2562_033152 [Oryza meyeriana var. granulata]
MHHPYRREDELLCTLCHILCCYNPIVTYLSHWAVAADDWHKETLLELAEQQGHLGDFEVDHHKLTYVHQQLAEEH